MLLIIKYLNAVIADPDIMGTFVSRDIKGTVIFAEFWAEEGFKSLFHILL